MAGGSQGRRARPIRIAAAIIADEQGRLLLVRKAGTAVFMQAGGKLRPHETPLAALCRELREEIGVEIDPERPPAYLGVFQSDAANEPGRRLEAHLFDLKLTGDVQPGAEICEVIWVDPEGPITVTVAPLTRLYALGAKAT
jgi:8-oxo-dGTP diphosphatase